RRLSYNTRSNRTRVIKTPGGKLTWLYEKKPAKGPYCGDCGGRRCAKCVRDRIVQAFLIEEQKIVKRVLK
ncbi:6578_t:CDS:2, partial [Racocetra fulgida]